MRVAAEKRLQRCGVRHIRFVCSDVVPQPHRLNIPEMRLAVGQNLVENEDRTDEHKHNTTGTNETAGKFTFHEMPSSKVCS